MNAVVAAVSSCPGDAEEAGAEACEIVGLSFLIE
jgi:hypothetical protein